MAQILCWAEREETVVTLEKLRAAVGDGLCYFERDGAVRDHTESLDAAVWGFLFNCMAGEDKVMFKQAAVCADIDSSRRIVRLIDNGLTIRLEQLRNEVRMLRAHPIKTLKGVTVGMAEFEKKMKDFVEVGGQQRPDNEIKSDLNAILPNELSDKLTVCVTDHSQSYLSFYEIVVYTCAQLLMRKRGLPIHHVGEDGSAQEGYAAGQRARQRRGDVEQAWRRASGRRRLGMMLHQLRRRASHLRVQTRQ